MLFYDFFVSDSCSLTFENMVTEDLSHSIVEQRALASTFLKRYVVVDIYLPKNIADPTELSLLLINDGQDLEEMKFSVLLNQLFKENEIKPLLCVSIHAGKDRKNEYGTAHVPDFAGRGTKAAAYQQFITEELLPFIHIHFAIEQFRQKGYCGFSLGGLSALDTVWEHPDVFSLAGVFSGSFWWRSKSLEGDYDDYRDRIMLQKVRSGRYVPGLRFYFTTGSLDETADRNKNGIIDSIDDTLDLIEELEKHGYNTSYDIRYINYEEGKHDVATWGKAMPAFLLWGWSK
jgi:iron(III)-enterobactin esterase